MSRELISFRRLVGFCPKMALDGSIIVEICDETMSKMWRKQSKFRVCLPACGSFSKFL